MLNLAVGTTGVSLDIQIVDDDRLPVTGLVAATFPTVKYSKGTGADATVSLSDLATLSASHTAGGVKERGEGVYRLDIPDDVASTVAIVRIRGEASGKRLVCPPIQIGLQDALVAAIGNAVASADFDNAEVGEITCIVGETSKTKSVTCLNSDGSPRVLTLWGDKRLIIERPLNRTDVQIVENDDITISGASDHVFTFQPSAAVLADADNFIWSLREADSNEEIIAGTLVVSYSPLQDA